MKYFTKSFLYYQQGNKSLTYKFIDLGSLIYQELPQWLT